MQHGQGFVEKGIAAEVVDDDGQAREAVGDFVEAQVEAGAQAIQVFDTSVGILNRELYEPFGLRYLQRLFARVAAHGVPCIYFPLAATHLLPACVHSGANVISLDWRTSLDHGYELYGPSFPLQGNLDPCLLFAPWEQIESSALDIQASAHGRPHIFNLGHGLLPDTPLESVRRLVQAVHAAGSR